MKMLLFLDKKKKGKQKTSGREGERVLEAFQQNYVYREELPTVSSNFFHCQTSFMS